MKYLVKIAGPCIVVLLTVFALLPFFHSGFFPMHDDEQVARLYDLNQALFSGNFPPRIAPNLGFGYGYPFFNFYPSFAYYVGEAFHLLGFSFIVSTKLMIATGFILSALFMYIFTKEFFGRVAGVVAGVAYTYASYHAIDVYVRGAFAEFFAFVFLPIIFWAIYKLHQKLQARFLAVGALSFAFLVLSHNLIAIMILPFLIMWAVYCLFLSKNRISYAVNVGLLFVFGFGLSAYFWLPSYFERQFTLVRILTTELANYSIHFVCVHQLWDSPWGYGGSIPGCFDGISFEVGKIQLISSFVAACLAVAFIKQKKYKGSSLVILLFTVFLAGALFMTTKYSKAIWDQISLLWYIQFPWRFLLIVAFISAFLTGSVVIFIKQQRTRIIVGGILIFLLIGLSFSRFTPQRYFHAQDSTYTDIQTIRWYTSSLAYEYVPQGIKTKKSQIGTTLVDIKESEIATQASRVVSGSMQVKTLTEKPHVKEFEVNVEKQGIFQINTFSFPGWHVLVNGKNVSYQDKNKLKLIQIPLNVGTNMVEAKFLDTPIRTAGNMISILSIIGLAGVLIILRKQAKHGKH